MTSLQIRLFGSPQVLINNEPCTISRQKAMALLVYLAVTQQSHRRQALAMMLWPESSVSEARTNLRRTLHRLRQAMGDSWFAVSRQEIGLRGDVAVDVVAFGEKITAVQAHEQATRTLDATSLTLLEEAVALQAAPFLEDFAVVNATPFTDWQLTMADDLQRLLVGALQQLIAYHKEKSAFATALPLARRWVQLNRLHEPAHRALMALYSAAGQQATAVRQYFICAQTLQDAYGIEPSDETKALLKTIEAKRPSSAVPPPTLTAKKRRSSKSAAKRPHNLPIFSDTFVGRQKEMAEIGHYLAETDFRLLTLRGLGGVGKTRLALQAVAGLLETAVFPDGIFFVDLAGVEQGAQLVPAIAEVLQISLRQLTDPLDQLVEQIQDKNMLLLLDNFEQLQGHVALLARLLEASSQLKLLVTSRHRLKLAGEVVLVLDGLPVPARQEERDGAVRLFAERAVEIDAAFDFVAERPFIHAICQLVEGHPLAVEMCAAWISTLPCDEILAEIQQGLDLLEHERRDIPDRHQNIRTVFHTSFKLLSGREQTLLGGLAVFRGGFSRAAAKAVAEAKLLQLRTLVSKSLLGTYQREGETRYQLHPLLRQFVLEQLSVADRTRLRAKHAHYFADFLAHLDTKRFTADHDQVAPAIFGETDNLYGMWEWLEEEIVGDKRPLEIADLILDKIFPVWAFTYYQANQYLEEKNILTRIRQPMLAARWDVGLARQKEAIAMVTAMVANLYVDLGELEKGLGLSQQAFSFGAGLDNARLESFLQRIQGRINLQMGRYVAAQENFQASAARASFATAKGYALQALARAFLAAGEHETALTYAEQAKAIYEQDNTLRNILNVGLTIGAIYRHQRRYREAIATYRQLVHSARQLEDHLLLMVALANFAHCLQKVGGYDESGLAWEEALRLAAEANVPRWQALFTQGFGHFLLERGSPQATTYIERGLQLALEIGTEPDILSGLIPVAHWKATRGSFEDALVLTSFIKSNQVADDEDRQAAAELWEELSAELPPFLTERANKRLKAASLESFVAMMPLVHE
ncbi:MAG: BTAD domain-containing putative transcriptional regulator [Chloroflexota bacterium]